MENESCLEKDYLMQIIPKLTKSQARSIIKAINGGVATQKLKRGKHFKLPNSARKRRNTLLKQENDDKAKKWLGYVNDLEKLSFILQDEAADEREVFKDLMEQSRENCLPAEFIDAVIPKIMDYKLAADEGEPFIMILTGNSGSGKTTAAKYVAKLMGLPYHLISAPQTVHSHGLTGEGSSYSSPDVGAIVKGILDTGCLNPVFIIDEVDKLPAFLNRTSITEELLGICDGSANEFVDNFLSFPIDVSRSPIIMTANYPEQIPRELKDRAFVYQFSDVNEDRLFSIMDKYINEKLNNRYSNRILIDTSVAKEYISVLYNKGVHSIRKHQQLIDGVLQKGYRKYLMSEDEKTVKVEKNMFDEQLEVMSKNQKERLGFN